MNYKLGRLPKKIDSRTLQFAKYFVSLPYAPQVSHWPNAAPLGMLLNDTIGDCTIAGALHHERIWSKANNIDYTPTDHDAFIGYSAVGGYITGMPSTDGGCACLDVLNYWRQVGLGGRKIMSFVQVNQLNHVHVQHASFFFGGVYVGINMPLSVQTQPDLWDIPIGGLTGAGQPGSWGGHAVAVVGYDQSGLDVITWGARIRMTWRFWDAYVEECYAMLSSHFVVNPNKAPNGFDLISLQADLALITR